MARIRCCWERLGLIELQLAGVKRTFPASTGMPMPPNGHYRTPHLPRWSGTKRRACVTTTDAESRRWPAGRLPTGALGLVWQTWEQRGIGPKPRVARNEAHVWKNLHVGPKDAFGLSGIGFWPTSIPWKTREFSTARLDAALVFHASSSRSSLFCAAAGRSSATARVASLAPVVASPTTPGRCATSLSSSPPSISSTISSPSHSFSPARVRRAAATGGGGGYCCCSNNILDSVVGDYPPPPLPLPPPFLL
jgi:hypothetical protein